MNDYKTGYKILIGIIVFVILLALAGDEKSRKLFRENEVLNEQIESLQSKIYDLEDYIKELEEELGERE